MDRIELPEVTASISPGVQRLLIAAAEKHGLPLGERIGAQLLENETPPVSLVFDLTRIVEYLAHATVDAVVAETVLDILRRINATAHDVIDACRREGRHGFASVRSGSRYYNLPADDGVAAAEALLVAVGLEDEAPAKEHFFWNDGIWIGGSLWRESERRAGPWLENAGVMPSAAFVAALGAIQVALALPSFTYRVRGSDAGVDLGGVERGDLQFVIDTLRERLPASTIGLDDSRSLLFVSNVICAATEPA